MNVAWSKSWTVGQPGEVALAWGCLLMTVSAMLAVQVMLGLLAFLMAPVAFGLLVSGALRARDDEVSAIRQWAGLVLILAGLGALSWAALQAAEHGGQMALRAQRLSQGIAVTMPASPPTNATRSLTTWLVPGLVGGGLWLRAAWSGMRCAAWAFLVLLIPPLILAFFRRYGLELALSA